MLSLLVACALDKRSKAVQQQQQPPQQQQYKQQQYTPQQQQQPQPQQQPVQQPVTASNPQLQRQQQQQADVLMRQQYQQYQQYMQQQQAAAQQAAQLQQQAQGQAQAASIPPALQQAVQSTVQQYNQQQLSGQYNPLAAAQMYGTSGKAEQGGSTTAGSSTPATATAGNLQPVYMYQGAYTGAGAPTLLPGQTVVAAGQTGGSAVQLPPPPSFDTLQNTTVMKFVEVASTLVQVCAAAQYCIIFAYRIDSIPYNGQSVSTCDELHR